MVLYCLIPCGRCGGGNLSSRKIELNQTYILSCCHCGAKTIFSLRQQLRWIFQPGLAKPMEKDPSEVSCFNMSWVA
jgi:hypothetical protein